MSVNDGARSYLGAFNVALERWSVALERWSVGASARSVALRLSRSSQVAATTVRRCSSVRHFRQSAASILPQCIFRLRMKSPSNECDDDVVLIKGAKSSRVVSIVFRGANDYMLDEVERSIHDSLSIVKRRLESNTVVAGGGAVEAALSVYLENLATTLRSREHLAIAEFVEALLVIPKVLAVNAAKDSTELVAKLRAHHHNAQTKADMQHLAGTGLDLIKGIVRNNIEAGVIEPAMSRVRIIQE